MSSGDEMVQALADALDEHRWESHGLSYGTPDRCSCGQETRPERGDDDVTDRRSRAMCQHVARAVVASEPWQQLVRERDEARAAIESARNICSRRCFPEPRP